jgi:hypothetical protein
MCPRFVDALDLQELPHGPLHSLFGALEPLLIDQFTRHAAARFPELHGQGRWQVGLHRGVVRVVSPDGHDVDDFIDAQGDLHADEGMISPLEAADARIELIRDYYALFEEAMSRLRSQRQLILRTLDAHVEPKIQAMAEELIAEVTAS